MTMAAPPPPSVGGDQYMRLVNLIISQMRVHPDFVITAGAVARLLENAGAVLAQSDRPDELLEEWEYRQSEYAGRLIETAFENARRVGMFQGPSGPTPLIDENVLLAGCSCLPTGPAG